MVSFFVFLLPALEKVDLIQSPKADCPEVFVVFLSPSKTLLITMVSSPTIEHCVTYTIGTDMAATDFVGWVRPDTQNTKNLFGFIWILLTEGSILDLSYEICQ